jgi:hypothetical protein
MKADAFFARSVRRTSTGYVKSVKSLAAHASRRSRSLSSGAHSRDPLARSLYEVVVFQQVEPHHEEAMKWPSRWMGCNTDL